jgi:hypothetical protein
MKKSISKHAQLEVLEALRERYRLSPKGQKSTILDQFTAVAGCHRKHATRLLASKPDAGSKPAVVERRVYGEAEREALIVLWEAADRVCGKRLKAILPSLVAALEAHGHLALDSGLRQRLLSASAATIDRLLASVRSQASLRKKRRAPRKPSKQVPIRTFADWKDPLPGYLEIDFVAHGGSSVEGTFLWSLVATDLCSGWIEVVPLLAREQTLVREGLEVIRRQLPVPILGIDSDNDSAFINDTLVAYCQERHLEFTRSRPYQKNDQAWIEQKNGAVVRRFVGYERFSGVVAGQCLAQLFQAVRLFVNHFQPSFKLRSKVREGAKVKKQYHPPATPCDRLLAHAAVSELVKEKLRGEHGRLDPLQLLHGIRESQSALAALASADQSSGPERESLQQFLAKLPQLWHKGEARPTHRGEDRSPRWWRTRQDPFADVWPKILLWLQENPEATAKSLWQRLQSDYPERFPEGQLRTLQRRLRSWRHVMARKLVYGCLGGEENGAGAEPCVVGAEPANGEREGAFLKA